MSTQGAFVMNFAIRLGTSVLLALILGAPATAGDLTPPAGAVTPTMKPLTDIEPRIAVNAQNTPGDATSVFRITTRGSYYLTGNLIGESGKSGISIEAAGVTLDLNGFSLIGVAGSLNGINMPNFAFNVVIRNGFVRSWGGRGLNLAIDSGSVESVVAANSGSDGFFNNIGSYTTTFINCQAIANTGRGFATSSIARVVGCTATLNTGIAVDLGSFGIMEGCVVTSNSDHAIRALDNCIVRGNNAFTGSPGNAALLVVGFNCLIEDNNLSSGQIGLSITGSRNRVRNNVVAGNGTNYQFAPGNSLDLMLSNIPQTIEWPANVTLAGNLTRFGTGAGITISSDDVTIDLGGYALIGTGVTNVNNDGIVAAGAFNNIVVRNGSLRAWGSSGIDLIAATGAVIEDVQVTTSGSTAVISGPAATLRRVSAFSNLSAGFTVGEDSTAEDCVARGNNAQGFILSTGARIRRCRATGNGVVGNFAGISVPGSSSIGLIEDCFVSGNDQGIAVSGTGWTIIRNVAKNNTANYSIGAGNHAGDTVATPGTADAYDNISN